MVYLVFRCYQLPHKSVVCLNQDLRKVPMLRVVDLPARSL